MGAVVRLIVGPLCDWIGGRLTFALLMTPLPIALVMIGESTTVEEFKLWAFITGSSGASFSVGIAYVARWFERGRQGLAMGIFGAGNAGAALTQLLAPAIITHYGWQQVPRIYAMLVAATLVLFLLLTEQNSKHIQREGNIMSMLTQSFKWAFHPHVAVYGLYYFLVFGGFVALALELPKFFVREFEYSLEVAGLFAAAFTFPGGVFRAFGGWLSDKYGAHRVMVITLWLSLFGIGGLAIPAYELPTPSGELFSYNPRDWIVIWVGTLFGVGFLWGIGKAALFKYLSDEFPMEMGTISGFVGFCGGLGPILLPLVFVYVHDILGYRSLSVFGVLFVVTGVCVVLSLIQSIFHSYGTKGEQRFYVLLRAGLRSESPQLRQELEHVLLKFQDEGSSETTETEVVSATSS